jgi:hypothetical protein
MKKIFTLLFSCMLAVSLFADPAAPVEKMVFNKPGTYFVSASINSGCYPSPAYFEIGSGLTASNFRVSGISPGINCVTGARADTQGFQLEAGRVIYSETRYLNNPPAISPAPLSTITLSPGPTYTLYAYGGRSAYVVLEFTVTGGLTTPPAAPGTTPATPTTPGATPGGPAVSGPKTLEGRWNTDWWGVLTININGSSATGTYVENQGRISGTLSADGRTIRGWWSEAPSYQRPEDAGIFNITISPDGRSISGGWHLGEDEHEFKLTGTRVR